ncbi:hypothetical protein [Bacteroides ihuae]|uniref:hypothetical protein n=1 Tax=Bacteroides ihuae TaxID=1852362 RepID=UPI00373FCE4B
MSKYGIVIFIHGCFWHDHKVDGHIPHSSNDYWHKKIDVTNKGMKKIKRLESYDYLGVPVET